MGSRARHLAGDAGSGEPLPYQRTKKVAARGCSGLWDTLGRGSPPRRLNDDHEAPRFAARHAGSGGLRYVVPVAVLWSALRCWGT